jgi:acyl-CoA thioester hydrolase
MPPFSVTIRVYYRDTDAGGIVFHANYLAFMEQARTEYLGSIGFDVAELASRQSVMFIVHRAALEFRRPARLNERLTVSAEPIRVGRARVVFRQCVARGDEALVEGEIQLACVDPVSFKPVPLPQTIRVKLGQGESQ